MTPENRTTFDTEIGQRLGRPHAGLWLIGLLSFAIVVAIAVLPPLPQPQVYSGLADDRTLLGIANHLNVVSNLPFLLVGIWGLYFLSRKQQAPHSGSFTDPKEKWPYVACFLGIALTCFGSAYYHLAPDSGRLVWDRLPMTFAFMSVLSAAIVERLSVKAGLRLLIPFLLIGVGSVIYWRWSQLHATENLLPYAAVQYGSIAIILVIALLFRSRYTRGTDIFVVVAIYAVAKVAEVLDAQIYALGQVVSGHTLKHLIAALAAYWLLRMLRLRSPASG